MVILLNLLTGKNFTMRTYVCRKKRMKNGCCRGLIRANIELPNPDSNPYYHSSKDSPVVENPNRNMVGILVRVLSRAFYPNNRRDFLQVFMGFGGDVNRKAQPSGKMKELVG